MGTRRERGKKHTHVVLRGPADVTALALNTLPAVGLHGSHHDRGELQARWVPWRGERKKQHSDRPGHPRKGR